MSAEKLAEALRLVMDQFWLPTSERHRALWNRQKPMFEAARAALAAHEAEAKAAPAARPEWMSCAGCDLPNGCPEFCKCGQAPSLLPPIARRRVFDAIAGAYDLGYSDRKAGRIGAAREVEIDHGGALIGALEKALAAAPVNPSPTPAPLTLDDVIKLAAVEFPSKYWQAVERLVRSVERAHGIGGTP